MKFLHGSTFKSYQELLNSHSSWNRFGPWIYLFIPCFTSYFVTIHDIQEVIYIYIYSIKFIRRKQKKKRWVKPHGTAKFQKPLHQLTDLRRPLDFFFLRTPVHGPTPLPQEWMVEPNVTVDRVVTQEQLVEVGVVTEQSSLSPPVASMYGIFTHIWLSLSIFFEW